MLESAQRLPPDPWATGAEPTGLAHCWAPPQTQPALFLLGFHGNRFLHCAEVSCTLLAGEEGGKLVPEWAPAFPGRFGKTAQKLCPEAQGTPRPSHVIGALPATCIDPGLHEVCIWPPCSSLCLSLPCPSSSLLFAQVGLCHKAPSLCTLFFLCKGILTPSLEHRSPPSCSRLQPAKGPLPAG